MTSSPQSADTPHGKSDREHTPTFSSLSLGMAATTSETLIELPPRQWAQDFYAGIEDDASVQTYASLNSTRGANVYTYFFTHSPPMTTEITEPNTAGCYHGAEQLYVFGNLPGVYPTISWNATELTIQDSMTTYWANFIKYGNPNGDGTTGSNLTYFPPSSTSAETMWLGDSWGPQSIGSEEKKQFVQDWFVATGYVY